MNTPTVAMAGLLWRAWHKFAAPAACRWRKAILRYQGATFEPSLHIGPGLEVSMDEATLDIGADVILEKDIYINIWPGARLVIGDDVYIGRNCIIEVHSSVHIGNHVMVAPFCHITDLNHGIEPGQLMRMQPMRSQPVTIGADVWLGAGCSVLPGVTIGQGAVLGARAVANKDVPANAVAVGVPAIVKRLRGRSPSPLGEPPEDVADAQPGPLQPLAHAGRGLESGGTA